MEETRICKLCKQEKLLTNFTKSKQVKTGYRVVCKKCKNAIYKEYVTKNKEHFREYHKKYREVNGRSDCNNLRSRLKALINGAQSRRNFDFSIDVEFLETLWENQNGLCVYTKLPLTIKPNQFNTISIDRRDSTKGYTKENTQLICRAVNEMKMDRTEELFIHLCYLVTQYNKDKENLVELAITV